MAILPLFFKTSVKTLKEKLKNHDLLCKRAELHAEDDRINCEEWRDPLKEICKFNGMEYPEDRGEVIYRDRMVHHIRLLFPPNLKYDDSLVQGKTRSCKVADLLEWRNGVKVVGLYGIAGSGKTTMLEWRNGVKVVGLYGIAGSGKTTICKTLCKFYSRKFKAKVFHAEIDTDLQRRIEAEKQALKVLTAASDDLLGSLTSEEQGSELLRARMPDHKVFVAIDSISHGSLSIGAAQSFLSVGFKEGSMIPLTARSRRMIKRLLREEESLLRHVPLLHDAEAMAILKLCDLTCAEIEVGKLCIKKCCFGGTCHPLALQAFGAYLFHKFGPRLLQWSEIPDFRDAKVDEVFCLQAEFQKLKSPEVALGWLAVLCNERKDRLYPQCCKYSKISLHCNFIWQLFQVWDVPFDM